MFDKFNCICIMCGISFIGDGIGDVVQLLVWEINEIERAEVEKEPKDWPVGDEVMCFVAFLLLEYW